MFQYLACLTTARFLIALIEVLEDNLLDISAAGFKGLYGRSSCSWIGLHGTHNPTPHLALRVMLKQLCRALLIPGSAPSSTQVSSRACPCSPPYRAHPLGVEACCCAVCALCVQLFAVCHSISGSEAILRLKRPICGGLPHLACVCSRLRLDGSGLRLVFVSPRAPHPRRRDPYVLAAACISDEPAAPRAACGFISCDNYGWADSR